MTTALGVWKNAPLVYVLAEVRTELIADLGEYQNKLAARLRSEYPVQRQLIAAKLMATASGMVPQLGFDQELAWEYASPDNRTGIIVRKNGLVLHSTAYKGSTDFLKCLNMALTAFTAEVPNVFVNQLGLRYIDFVIPQKGESPDLYISNQLNPAVERLTGNTVISAMSVARYAVKDGFILLRYMVGKGQPELPPDVTTFALEKSPLMVSAVDPDQLTAVIDTDRVRGYKSVESLDTARVTDEFVLMHQDVSNNFKNIMMTHAQHVWNPQ